MKSRTQLWIALAIVASAAVIIVISVALTPANTNFAYAAAVDFTNLATKGQTADASALMDDNLRAYVAENCPSGDVGACVQAYAPADWGAMISAVFRRSIPDGNNAWDIQLVATYEEEKGFSGVCIYNRVERFAELAEGDAYDGWRVTRWSGFIPCDDALSGIQNLRGADAPNRAP